MLGSRTHAAPDGRTWQVGREWVSHRVRLRRRGERDADDGGSFFGEALSWGFDDITPAGILIGLAVALTVLLLFTVIVPVIAIALEILLLIVLFLASLAGRLVLRRPWRIRARTKGPPAEELAWHVVGWRASRRAIEEVKHAVAAGELTSSRDDPPGWSGPRAATPASPRR